MFLWKLIFQNVAKYLTQNFVNKTKSVWPEGKAETYFSFFPYKNEKIYHGVNIGLPFLFLRNDLIQFSISRLQAIQRAIFGPALLRTN